MVPSLSQACGCFYNVGWMNVGEMMLGSKGVGNVSTKQRDPPASALGGLRRAGNETTSERTPPTSWASTSSARLRRGGNQKKGGGATGAGYPTVKKN